MTLAKMIGLAGVFALTACGDTAPKELRPPERAVTADEIFTAFTTNQIAARRDFQETPVTVSGEIVLVDDGIIMLNTGAGPRVGLNMLTDHASGMADLKVGDTYAADCEGAYEVKAVVGMQNCRPHQPPASASSAGASAE